ncbi:hypothetical protein VP01_1697g2 [Puccinia sorghi]|uniref:Integrase catalytic domain-containing protein n=1 Tax=Puccinia sorghi TaxID=27349 RepID=A0A0L6VHL2_9BASI|nr:hypothetical protein VP01_1697g2 [Puccinia sorghi]
MDKINTNILKTAIEAIPLLTNDNYTLWKNRAKNMLDMQELWVPLTSPTGVLSSTEDVQLRTILTSKLESSIHANFITHDNEKSAQKIWKSISEYFTSSQASNRAGVFNAVLHIQFNPNDVQHFITQVKTSISCLHEMTHSDKPITVELVLNHLRLYANNQQSLANSGVFSKSASVSLLTDDSKKYHSEQIFVRTSSGEESLEIKGIGTIKLSHDQGELLLHCVLFVPSVAINLLSVRCLVLAGFNFQFLKNSFTVSRNNDLLITGRYKGNLPSLDFLNKKEQSYLSAAERLHKSMGHASFNSKHQQAKIPFEELHLDLIGTITPTSREGDRYILTVVDSNTRYCSATPITQKSDVFNTLSTILDFEAKRFGYYPSVLHLDRGGEFINSLMKEYCRKHLIRKSH